MVEIKLDGKVVSRSQNLRGILRYAQHEPVVRVYVKPDRAWEPEALDCGARVSFHFYNSAVSRVHFESAQVAHNWIKSRRSWGEPTLVGVILDSIVYDYLEE